MVLFKGADPVVATGAGEAVVGLSVPFGRVRACVALTKPRIIELLLVTTVPTMLLARTRGLPGLTLVVATLVGGIMASGGANALNMVIDRDIDRTMSRTSKRPLVTGAITPLGALTFALCLEALAFVELALLVNVLSAVLAIGAAAFYIFVYTMWLKRTSRQNIVIGGAAGAVPVLVGWSAVTGRLALAPVVLFGVIFLWTPPHFWALAFKYQDDYRAANVPMLPAVAPAQTVSKWVTAYTAATVAASLVFGLVAHVGLIYWAAAVALGAMFLWMAVTLQRLPSPKTAMRLFGYSITYLTLLFAAIALDQLVAKA